MRNEIVAVPFGEDVIEAMQDPQSRVWIVPKRICESLGVDFAGQFAKLRRAHWAGIEKTQIPDPRGCLQETCIIPLDSLPMWLATISPSKLAEPLREKLKRYQVEARDVLARHFLGRRQEPPQPADVDPIKSMLLAALETRERQLQLASELQTLQIEHLKITCAIEASEARLVDAERQVREAIERAAEAQQDANRALRTVTSEADCFTLVTWAEGQGVKLISPYDAIEGKRLTAMCRAAGITVGRMSTTRYPVTPDGKGGVHVYPVDMLRKWLVDYLKRNPLKIGA